MYIKNKMTPIAKLSILKPKGTSLRIYGAMKFGVPARSSKSKQRYLQLVDSAIWSGSY
jgi:hypothetical protein